MIKTFFSRYISIRDLLHQKIIYNHVIIVSCFSTLQINKCYEKILYKTTLSLLMSQKNPLSHKITFFVVATFPPTTFVYFLRFLSCYSLFHQVSLAYHVTLLLLNSVHKQSVPTTVTNLITIQSWIRACFEKNVILKTNKNLFCRFMHSFSVSVYHNTVDFAVIIQFIKKKFRLYLCILYFKNIMNLISYHKSLICRIELNYIFLISINLD